VQMSTTKRPIQGRPRERLGQQALDRPVTTISARPARLCHAS
jgi:hypothetical protein